MQSFIPKGKGVDLNENASKFKVFHTKEALFNST
jgi:hypothetical protein